MPDLVRVFPIPPLGPEYHVGHLVRLSDGKVLLWCGLRREIEPLAEWINTLQEGCRC